MQISVPWIEAKQRSESKTILMNTGSAAWQARNRITPMFNAIEDRMEDEANVNEDFLLQLRMSSGFHSCSPSPLVGFSRFRCVMSIGAASCADRLNSCQRFGFLHGTLY